MTTSDFPAQRQAPCITVIFPAQTTLLAASNRASVARDQFWTARHVGDRPAMIHWSARESELRRGADGLTALAPLPAAARAVA